METDRVAKFRPFVKRNAESLAQHLVKLSSNVFLPTATVIHEKNG